MRNTTNALISTIKKNEFTKFRFFIGPELDVIGKDEGMLYADFSRFRSLLGTHSEDIDTNIQITNLYNHLGQRIVEIPIKRSANTGSTDSIYHLYLFFGPPDLYPLTKITGYQLAMDTSTPYGFHRTPGR
ncbi:hypothetical protein [Chitinophaga sp.]|uniref:hypothetical protein n=1 Tax=Chitinophaga sp. TaxID=1869181 RepID=UPI002F921FE3